jgi:hypothetical protein
VGKVKDTMALVELQHRFRSLINAVKECAPIVVQRHFTQYVNKLQSLVVHARKARSPIDPVRALLT